MGMFGYLSLGKFVDGKAGSNLLKRFSAGGVDLLVLFVNGDDGSNPVKQISSGEVP